LWERAVRLEIYSKDLDGIEILWSVDQERVLTKDK